MRSRTLHKALMDNNSGFNRRFYWSQTYNIARRFHCCSGCGMLDDDDDDDTQKCPFGLRTAAALLCPITRHFPFSSLPLLSV